MEIRVSTTDLNEIWGEGFYRTIDGFLEQERPFTGIEMSVRAEQIPSDSKPVPDDPNESSEYIVDYRVRRHNDLHEVSDHPIAQLNNNVHDKEAAEKKIKQQVGNIAARLKDKYAVPVSLAFFGSPTRAVDQEFLKELGSSPTARIEYVTTRASVKQPYAKQTLRLSDSAQ